MAGITKQQAEAKLALWMAADDAVAKGQSISVAGRSLTSADADVINENIQFWDAKIRKLSRGGLNMKLGVPVG